MEVPTFRLDALGSRHMSQPSGANNFWSSKRRLGGYLLRGCLLVGGLACGACLAAPRRQAPGPIAALPGSTGSPVAATTASSEPPPRETPAPTAAAGAQTSGSSGLPWLGLELVGRDPGLAGVLVRSVINSSPAERAGLLAEDILVSIDGKAISSPEEVIATVQQHQLGESLALGLERKGARRMLRAELTARPSSSDIVRGELIGKLAPEVAPLEEIQGSPKHTLRSLRGKVVVLEFWAPWCGICQYLVPTLNAWHAELRPQGLELMGITSSSVGESTRTAFQLGMKYPLASDESGETTKTYKAMAIPMVVVIDRSGTVRDVLVGYSAERLSELRTLIEQLLKQG